MDEELVVKKHITKSIDDLCLKEGWELSRLSEEMGFPLSYHRGHGKGKFNFKFPPQVHFISLTKEPEHCITANDGFNFYIGLARTEYDPSSGSVEQHHRHILGNSIDADMTAFGAFIYYKTFKAIVVRCIQAAAVKYDDRETVKTELLNEVVSGPHIYFKKRTNQLANLDKYGVPWDYSDRLLLFGAAAVWFAKQLGVEKVIFDKSCHHEIYRRTYDFANRNVSSNPGLGQVSVELIPEPFFDWKMQLFKNYLDSPN